MRQSPQKFTVSQLVQAIRQLVEGVPEWQHLWVQGELSGVKHHSSGHWYFVMKDDQAQIRSVMFRRDALSLGTPLRDGMQVLALGRVGVFERDGQTQLYVTQIHDIGAGKAHLALEALKQKLAAEGLFSRPKRALPLLPKAVGVVTSPTGAARHDIETVIGRRYPGMSIRLYPVLVQGKEATAALVEALSSVSIEDVDVVIVGRGGGSKEDLMVFNEEAVVRAIARCPVPVISAVGHEIDTTLVDLAADLRAATPSAAAELAVPELVRLVHWQNTLMSRAQQAIFGRIDAERRRLAGWTTHGILTQPELLLREAKLRLDRLQERADRSWERRLREQRHRWDRAQAQIQSLNPEAILDRGYAYVTNREGSLVTAVQIMPDELYQIHWYNGSHWVTRVNR